MAISFLDKTFCSSPNCINKCGRKMTESERAALIIWSALMNPSNDHNVEAPVSYGYFCAELESKK